jgi:hypothetical protein
MGEECIQGFGGKLERKRSLGRPRRRWEDSINTDLRETGLDPSGSGYRPVKGSCEHGNEPSDSIKFWEFVVWLSNCRLLKKDSLPWS